MHVDSGEHARSLWGQNLLRLVEIGVRAAVPPVVAACSGLLLLHVALLCLTTYVPSSSQQVVMLKADGLCNFGSFIAVELMASLPLSS